MSCNHMYLSAIGMVVLGSAVFQPVARAQCDPAEIAKLLASDGAASDGFGKSVCLSGLTAVVGAYGDDDRALNAGAAYIFEKIGGVWTERAKLLASDGAAGDRFGVSVSICGETALVGAHGDDRGSAVGAAYVFERVGGAWIQTAKLLASDGAAGDFFGVSVSLSGDAAIVGASRDDDRGADSGSAYIFEKVGGVWTQIAKLLDSDGQFYDWFGGSVFLNGHSAIVAAAGDADRGSDSGSAFIFAKVGGVWSQTAKLLASDGEYYDLFGSSVSLNGEVAIVGAIGDNDRGADSGSAYVFQKVGGVWIEAAKLRASDGAGFDEFGRSVSIIGDTAVVGAHQDDDRGNLSGSAYIFKKVGGVWTEGAKLFASDAAREDYFGHSVSIDGNAGIVGALGKSDLGIYSGAAYVFDLNCGPTLRMVGRCPGRTDFVLEGATADGRVAFLYARGPGRLRVPDGNPCAGTRLGLDATTQLASVVRADGAGTASLPANVPAGACGRVYVQGLDLESCGTTNVVLVN